MWEALESRARRARELETLLSDPSVLANGALYQRYAKERAALTPFIALAERVAHLRQGGERGEMAAAGRRAAASSLAECRRQMEELLLEEDPDAARNAVVEIRAGTGGLEASLFAAAPYRMYTPHPAAR